MQSLFTVSFVTMVQGPPLGNGQAIQGSFLEMTKSSSLGSCLLSVVLFQEWDFVRFLPPFLTACLVIITPYFVCHVAELSWLYLP